MGRLGLWALVCCLAMLGFSAQPGHCQTATVKVIADFDAIQNAINNLPEENPTSARVIQIAAGTVDFGTRSLVLNKLGVTLQGAGPGSTIFQTADTTATAAGGCYSAAEGVPLLQVCRTAAQFQGSPNTPMIIDGITFKNSNPSFNTNGAEKGIGIARSPGPSPSNPSIIRNCQFLNIWKTSTRNSGIAIEFSTLAVGGVGSNNWRIAGNTFDTSYQGVFINANDDITITGNSFTRFWAGVRQSTNDVTTGLTITENTFDGGWGDAPTVTVPSGMNALSLSAAATTAGQDKNWLISNNMISAVTVGIEFRGPTGSTPPASMQGVNISVNSIIADWRCTLFDRCWSVRNNSPVPPDVTNNLWDVPPVNPPNDAQFSPTSASNPGRPIFDPWIVDFTAGTCPSGPNGFCPTNVIDSNAPPPPPPPPAISLVVKPQTTSAGSTVTVTVTLQPGADGIMTFQSTPEGVVCPPVLLKAEITTYVVKCEVLGQAGALTAQPAAAYIAAVSAQSGKEGIQDSVAAAYVRGSSRRGEGLFPDLSLPVTPVTQRFVVTVTVTVTATGQTVTGTFEVRVCENQPWPFRAHVFGCRGCSYNCATEKFSCRSCPCHCPVKRHYSYESPRSESYDRDHADYERPDREYEKPYYTTRNTPTEEESPYLSRSPDGDRGGEHDEPRSHAVHRHATDSGEPDHGDHEVAGAAAWGDDGNEDHYAVRKYGGRLLRPQSKERERRSLRDAESNRRVAATAFAKPDEAVGVTPTWTPVGIGANYRDSDTSVLDVDCEVGEPKCVCGPVPVTVGPSCAVVTYSACDNALQCVSAGDYRY